MNNSILHLNIASRVFLKENYKARIDLKKDLF